MTTPAVHEQAAPIVENIGSDILGSVMSDLLPGAGTPAPIPAPKPKENAAAPGGEGVDVSDLTPPAKPVAGEAAAPAPAKPASEPAKPAEGLSPADLKVAPAAKPDDLPAGLLKDAEIETVFKGDEKAKAAILKERAYNKELRTQLKALQAKAAEPVVDVAAKELAERLQTENEALKARAEALESDIGKIDLTRSPAFKAQFDDRINAVAGQMMQTLVKEGVDAKEAEGFVRRVAAEQRPSVRERMIEDAAPGLRGTLTSLSIQLDELVAAKTAAVENWQATAAALEDASARERVAAITGKVDSVVNAATEEVVKLGNPYFMQTDDPEWNAQVMDRIKLVRGVLLTGDFAKIAPLVAEGVTAADLRSRYTALLTSKRALEAELDAVLKGSPRLRSAPQAPGGSPAPAPTVVEGESLDDAITRDLLPPPRR